jgi:hypothetical protein
VQYPLSKGSSTKRAEAAQLRCAQVTEVLSGQVIDFSEEERGLLRSFKGLPKI